MNYQSYALTKLHQKKPKVKNDNNIQVAALALHLYLGKTYDSHVSAFLNYPVKMLTGNKNNLQPSGIGFFNNVSGFNTTECFNNYLRTIIPIVDSKKLKSFINPRTISFRLFTFEFNITMAIASFT